MVTTTRASLTRGLLVVVLLGLECAALNSFRFATTDSLIVREGQPLYATVGVPLPKIRFELVTASGSPFALAHEAIEVHASLDPPGDALMNGHTSFVNGVAVLPSLTFRKLVSPAPRLSFTATTNASYPVGGKVVRTGTVELVTSILPAYGIRFHPDGVIGAEGMAASVTHGVPLAPTVAVEVVNSAHLPDSSVGSGRVQVTATSGGMAFQGIAGAEASVYGGIATFPSLAFTATPPGDVSLTFTFRGPGRLNLQRLESGPITVIPSKQYALRFHPSNSYWTAEGQTREVEHGVTLSPPAVVEVIDSAGNVDTSATGVVSASSGGVALKGEVSQVLSGTASFPNLLVAGWNATVVLTFSYKDTLRLSTGANPMYAKAFTLRVSPTPPGEVKEGETLPTLTVEVLDSKGVVQNVPGMGIEAVYNDSQSVQPLATRPVSAGKVAFTGLSLTAAPLTVLTFRESAPPTTLAGNVSFPIRIARRAASLTFAQGSAVKEGGTLPAVPQQTPLPPIILELRDSNGLLDTGTNGVVLATSNKGLGGTTRVNVDPATGKATFNNLIMTDVGDALLTFTLETPGFPASGVPISTGVVTVVGPPHHIARKFPYPTGAVLGRPIDIVVEVRSEDGTLVDPSLYPSPTISVSGVGVVPSTWTGGMTQSVRFTLGPPLQPGDRARVVLEPRLSGVTFVPATLELVLAVSSENHSVDHASFVDPYTVPTVVRVRERQSVRVAMFTAASATATDSDAAYTVVSGEGVVMLGADPTTGGMQTVYFEFRGAAERDSTVVFQPVMPGKALDPLTRLYKVLPGPPAAIRATPVPTAQLGVPFQVDVHIADAEGNVLQNAGNIKASGDGVVQLGNVELVLQGAVTPRNITFTAPSVSPDSFVVAVRAGRPHHLEIDIPSTAYTGELQVGTATVVDQWGNKAADADGTSFAVGVDGEVGGLVLATDTPTVGSVKTLRYRMTGAARVAGVRITPSLSGVVFAPPSEVRQVTVVATRHAMRFAPSPPPDPLVVVGNATLPPMTIVITDSTGKVDSSASSEISITATGALGETTQVVLNGEAQFVGLTASSTSSVVFTAMAPGWEVHGKRLVVPLSIIVPSAGLRFATSRSLFTAEGQSAAAVQHTPLDPIRVLVVDSAGNLDARSTGTIEASAGSVPLTGTVAPVQGGEAVFLRLAFLEPPAGPVAITFAAKGMGGVQAEARPLQTGPVEVAVAPSSIAVRSVPINPATWSPPYLVYGSQSTVLIDVLASSGGPAPRIPDTMAILVASADVTASTPVKTGLSQFSVTITPTVPTATTPTATVIYTPFLPFTPFDPPSYPYTYNVCPSKPARGVFLPGTPQVLDIGLDTPISLDLVDQGGSPLKLLWGPECREARRQVGVAPPYAEAINVTVSGTGIEMSPSRPVSNVNGTLTAWIRATREFTDSTATFLFTGGPGTMEPRQQRVFSSAYPTPTGIAVTADSPTSVESGGTAHIRVEVQNSRGQVVSTDETTTVSLRATGDGSVLLESQTTQKGIITATIRVYGPPRAIDVTLVPVRSGIDWGQAVATAALQVLYANASLGTHATQWYQIFPDYPFPSAESFQGTLSARLTTLSADAPYCGTTKVCRRVAAGNVYVAPVSDWPVPPVGDATPHHELPSERAYVVQLRNVEEHQVPAIEQALRRAHTDPSVFPGLVHSTKQPVKFLKGGGVVVDRPYVVNCSAIAPAAACDATEGCRWVDGRCEADCIVHKSADMCRAAGCRWYGTVCQVPSDPDGGFADDLFGQEWWVLVLLGALLLLICCGIAYCCRVCCMTRAWWKRRKLEKRLKKANQGEEGVPERASAGPKVVDMLWSHPLDSPKGNPPLPPSDPHPKGTLYPLDQHHSYYPPVSYPAPHHDSRGLVQATGVPSDVSRPPLNPIDQLDLQTDRAVNSVYRTRELLYDQPYPPSETAYPHYRPTDHPFADSGVAQIRPVPRHDGSEYSAATSSSLLRPGSQWTAESEVGALMLPHTTPSPLEPHSPSASSELTVDDQGMVVSRSVNSSSAPVRQRATVR
eukprot:Sspe_Gene.59589::Locus_32757_Transcript_2_3_Confidence_0.500_Length_8529::g.59589::m.59589